MKRGHQSVLSKLALSGSTDELFRFYHSSEVGLTQSEAQSRLQKIGANVLPEASAPSLLVLFLRQWTTMLGLLLLFACALSWWLGETAQSISILCVIVLNACIGVWQEYKADRAVRAFKALLPVQARVLRSSDTVTVPVRDMVIGDVVVLSAGELVPADMRLLKSQGVEVDESLLTGESEPTHKRVGQLKDSNQTLREIDTIVFSGTHLVRGECKGLVIATGERTVLGSIAGQTLKAPLPHTPLEEEIKRVGVFTAYLAIGVAMATLLVSTLFGKLTHDTLFTVVSMAVAAVPEGLATTVSLTLGLGVLRMLKRNVIVRRLPAVEALGSVTVICTDKTGTLTTNEITHTSTMPIFKSKQTDAWVSVIAALCHNATRNPNTQKEDAVDRAVMKMVSVKESARIIEQYSRIVELPFDSSRKRMSVIVTNHQDNVWCLTKGAPQTVMKCLSKKYVKDTQEVLDKIVGSDHKILLLALRQLKKSEWIKYEKSPAGFEDMIEADLMPVAFILLKDPLREGVLHSIAEAKKAGIQTIMVTGDWQNTALATAKEAQIYDTLPHVITGDALRNMSNGYLQHLFKNNKNLLFAEIEAAQKQKIITALRACGEVVAMTGDGVNDAPALKQAHVGVSMGKGGTDVARSASDIILKDDSFSTIVSAIREGRGIYSNIKKFIFYEFGANAAQLLVVLGALVLGTAVPLLPIHIIVIDLWIGLLPSLALGVDPPNPRGMEFPPRRLTQPLLSGAVIRRVLRDGAVVASGAIIYFYLTLSNGSGELSNQNEYYAKAVTGVFVIISFCQIGLAFQARSNKRRLLELLSTPNIRLYQACIISFLMLLLFVYTPFFNKLFVTTPLPFVDWLYPAITLCALLLLENATKERALI